MSKILSLIKALSVRPTKPQLEDVITYIGAAEIRRIEIEAKYLRSDKYKMLTINIEPARAWLAENGKVLDVVRCGPMWAIVTLTCIEIGVLGERQYFAIEYDENEKSIELPFDELDYERI